jgi:hypothetical protein
MQVKVFLKKAWISNNQANIEVCLKILYSRNSWRFMSTFQTNPKELTCFSYQTCETG